MNATARKFIARLRTALRRAAHITRAARYAALNGALATDLAEGRLIQASVHLRALGLTEDEVRSFRSHFGKTTKRAYRAAHGNLDPQTAWVLIDGRWMNVCVYSPADPALRVGVTAYARLAETVRAQYSEAA